MISSDLTKNIFDFVYRIGVVEEDQIKLFFKDTHNPETVDFLIKNLVRENKINMEYDTRLLKRRQFVEETDLRQQLLTECAWVLAYMGEKKVREYAICDYPCQMIVICDDDTVYDFTVFTYSTLNSLKMYVPMKRKASLPEGVEDTIIHVAILPDKDMADDIKLLDFDSYCIMDRYKKPKYYQWED